MGNGTWHLPFSELTVGLRDNTYMQITIIHGIIISCIAKTKCLKHQERKAWPVLRITMIMRNMDKSNTFQVQKTKTMSVWFITLSQGLDIEPRTE